MRRRVFLAVLLIGFLTAGCKAGGKQYSADKAIATVNGSPISAQDLRRELDIRAKKDPSFKATPEDIREQAEVLINRRLLIREAQDRRLTEDDRFRQTIQTFWEQTLVRLLMERFHTEFQAMSSVSEEEIKAYYALLGNKATFQVLEVPTQAEAIEIAKTAQAGGPVAWKQTIGPVRYDEIRSGALERAFSFSPGQAKVFSENGVHVVVRLAAKEADTPPALEVIHDKIKSQLQGRKERRAFESWLREKREAAKVKLSLENYGNPL